MVGVVVDHAHDLSGKFSCPPPREQVEQAVGLFAGHESDSRHDVGESKIHGHVETLGNGSESGEDSAALHAQTVEFEFDALKEHFLDLIGVLLGVDDVPVVRGDEIGHRSDDAASVGTRKKEDTVARHPGSLLDPGANSHVRFPDRLPLNDTVGVGDPDPLVIRSAGTLLDETGEVYPVVRVDAARRPELRTMVDVIANEGVGDLATFAELCLGEGGRRVVRLTSRLATPVTEAWAIDFVLPGFEDLLRLAAECGGLVVSFVVEDRDDDQWLGLNLDGEALIPLLT
jgi:hypothetical protein